MKVDVQDSAKAGGERVRESGRTLRITWLDVASSYSHASTALPRLHAACAHLEFLEWRRVSSTVGDSIPEIVYRVWKTQPDILAGTVYLFNREAVLAVAARIHAILPRCHIVFGGPEWLGDNRGFLEEHPEITAVFRGEGEHTFPAWLSALRSSQPFERFRRLPGLCMRLPGGGFLDNGRATASPDEIPSPVRSPFFPWDRPFVQIETARGCPFSCSFCTSGGDAPLRFFPVQRVREELTACRNHGIREIRILDRTFNADPARAQALLEIFRTEFAEMRFHLEWRPELLPPVLESALRNAVPGQLHLEIGIQTLAPAPARAVHRKADPERAWAHVHRLQILGTCRLHLDLIAGLPEQTLEHVRNDLRRLILLGPEEIQLELLKVLPGTVLSANSAGLGLIFSPLPPYEVLRTPHMAPEALQWARRSATLLDRFYNCGDLRQSFREAALADPEFLDGFLEFLEAREALTRPLRLERRFQLFFEFADREKKLEAVRDLLVLAWLRRGLSPQHGLVPAHPWTEPIPGDAACIEGKVREGVFRTWHIRLHSGEYWLVFSRGAGRRRAVAVFHRGARGAGLGA